MKVTFRHTTYNTKYVFIFKWPSITQTKINIIMKWRTKLERD